MRITRLTAASAVMGATIASTLAVATAAHATTCSSKVGTYMTIEHCGTTTEVTYNRPTGLGHAEICDYHNTSLWRNGINCSNDAGANETWTGNPWDDRTCVEFWLPNGS